MLASTVPLREHLGYWRGMEKTGFTILLGGTLSVTERVRQAASGTRVIAADNGMRHAKPLSLVPELWVGDFDSTDTGLLAEWPDVERHTFPASKAATDGEIAVSQAIERGAQNLVLIGALGGDRTDHAFQHMLNAISLKEKDYDVTLLSGEEEAYPLVSGGSKKLDLPAGSLFSVLGFSDLDGLDIENARYPLKDFSLTFGTSRTISNVAEGPVRFSLKSGRAIILARPYDMTGA